jgi:predicted MFS family arabinose efflux permease
MNFLAAGVYVPLHRAVGGSTDWALIVGLIVVMAIALTAVLVYANRSVKTPPSSESEPADSDRKAA